jgi:hypothetical protein
VFSGDGPLVVLPVRHSGGQDDQRLGSRDVLLERDLDGELAVQDEVVLVELVDAPCPARRDRGRPACS